MSADLARKADSQFKRVLDYFDQIEEEAVPKAVADVHSFQQFMDGTKETMTHREVGLVFKDKVLLKAGTRASKKRRRGEIDAEDEEDDEHEDEEEEEEECGGNSDTRTEFVRMAYGVPRAPTFAAINRRMKWTEADLKDVQKRAAEHQAYLRRLLFRAWDKLERHEQERINEYMQKTQLWIEQIRSQKERHEFMFRALPMMQKIEELASEVTEEVNTTHSLHRVGLVDRKAAKALEAATLAKQLENGDSGAQSAVALTTTSSSALTTTARAYSSDWAAQAAMRPTTSSLPPRIDEQVNAMKSDTHKELTLLYHDLEKLCDYYTQLYGKVRGSGDVVDKPEVQVGTSPPLMESDNQEDPWVTSGLLCPDCGIQRIINPHEACASCPQCGVNVDYQELSLKSYNFGDEPEIKRTRRRNYKPESYAAQWLRKVSGKLGIEVPEEVVTMLFAEFHRKRLAKVSPKIVRKALQRNNLTEYYKCVPYLTYKFNEVPLANFSEEEREILDQMFDEYREAFQRCPQEIKKRSNLMSYAYFFYKSVEIRQWYHYMKCFPLLEGDDHIRRHDRTWKWICEHKKGEPWPFHPTRVGI